jgi:uncharacterized protein (DUF849 family)
MDAAVWALVGTLAGAVLGAAASIATTAITNRHAARLQTQADSLEREERARAFQRETLLSVQEALGDLLRMTGRAYHEDLVAHRAGCEWGKSLLSDEVDQGLLTAHRRLRALEERIADDGVRSELKDLHSSLTWEVMAKTREQAEATIGEATDGFNRVMTHLGELLRSTY